MYGYGNNVMGDWGLGGGFGMFIMPFFWILIIVGAVLFIVWLVNQTGGVAYSSPAGTGKSAMDILKERYARGEIDKQEFEEKKKDLA